MESAFEFQWSSKLGISTILFLIYGGLHFLFSVGAPFAVMLVDADRILFMSDKADVVYYGEAPRDMLARDPILVKFRRTMFHALAALMCSTGIMVMAVAWFGLRQGHTWALVTLGIVGFAVLPYYALLFAPYVRAGAPLLVSIPPYIWLPTLLYFPGMVLGWLGLHPG